MCQSAALYKLKVCVYLRILCVCFLSCDNNVFWRNEVEDQLLKHRCLVAVSNYPERSLCCLFHQGAARGCVWPRRSQIQKAICENLLLIIGGHCVLCEGDFPIFVCATSIFLGFRLKLSHSLCNKCLCFNNGPFCLTFIPGRIRKAPTSFNRRRKYQILL